MENQVQTTPAQDFADKAYGIAFSTLMLTGLTFWVATSIVKFRTAKRILDEQKKKAA